jgi:hypothetical protein
MVPARASVSANPRRANRLSRGKTVKFDKRTREIIVFKHKLFRNCLRIRPLFASSAPRSTFTRASTNMPARNPRAADGDHVAAPGGIMPM